MIIRKLLTFSTVSLIALVVATFVAPTTAVAQDLGIEVGAKAPVVTVQSDRKSVCRERVYSSV